LSRTSVLEARSFFETGGELGLAVAATGLDEVGLGAGSLRGGGSGAAATELLAVCSGAGAGALTLGAAVTGFGPSLGRSATLTAGRCSASDSSAARLRRA
jgi:hypothetical protein